MDDLTDFDLLLARAALLRLKQAAAAPPPAGGEAPPVVVDLGQSQGNLLTSLGRFGMSAGGLAGAGALGAKYTANQLQQRLLGSRRVPAGPFHVLGPASRARNALLNRGAAQAGRFSQGAGRAAKGSLGAALGGLGLYAAGDQLDLWSRARTARRLAAALEEGRRSAAPPPTTAPPPREFVGPPRPPAPSPRAYNRRLLGRTARDYLGSWWAKMRRPHEGGQA